MDGGWYINLGRMHVDGEKMKTKPANTLNTNPNIPPNDSKPRTPGQKYSKDYFSLIFMYLEGEEHPLLMGRRNTTVDEIILLL